MFKLPEEVKKDIAKYKTALQDLNDGKIPASRFKGIRVPWGVYSQRGGEVHMTRVRIPAGQVTAEQLKALSFVSKKYGDGILHITTRQDIQVHKVSVDNTLKVIEYLKDFDLSPRGGGGNTVRNVTACDRAGICPDEVFDVRGFAEGLTEYLLRQETSYTMPRKFKVTFVGCREDCAGCLVNDVGFLAALKDDQKGFKVYAGGGMGAVSRIGQLLEEWIPADDVGYCTAAVKNVFNAKGDRKNRHRNRLRFLIEDIGFDQFRTFYRQELARLKENEYISLRCIAFPDLPGHEADIPDNDDPAYRDFLRYSVSGQKQKGYAVVKLRIPRGNLAVEQILQLADLKNSFPTIGFSTSRNQNLFLYNIQKEDVYRLFTALKKILSDFLYPETLCDIVTCTGALTCNLGLCNSPGLAVELEKLFKEHFVRSPVFDKLDLKINGCPNACGQHPLGRIALHGMVRKVDNRSVPFYKLFLGGRKKLEKTRLAREAGILPGRSVPLFMVDLIKHIEAVVKENTDIDVVLEEKGFEVVREIIDAYTYVPSHEEDRLFYVDWGRSEEFSLAGIGQSECGAGVIDLIESDLAESTAALAEAQKKGYPASGVCRSLFLSSRALLVVRGIEPRNEMEAIDKFREAFIDTNIADPSFADIVKKYGSLQKDDPAEKRSQNGTYARRFLDHVKELYRIMDSSFNFPRRDRPPPAIHKDEKPGAFLDLKGVACPINYVKTKLFMENMEKNDILELLLDEGEPIRNVPKSLENDGHQILSIDQQGSIYKVVVKKQ